MKRILLIFCIITLSLTSFAQVQNNLTIGPDLIVPYCDPCTTLHAKYTPYSANITNYAVNQITYAPYSFTGANMVSLSDDQWSGVVCIPFDFYFFGNSYDECVIGSNGLITFNIGQANGACAWNTATVAPLPNPAYATALNTIMCPHHDLLPTAGGTINYGTYGVAPNRVFVVSWNNTAMFSCTSLPARQQLVLHESTNKIETFIESKATCSGWNGGRAIHGIQNAAGTIAITVPGRNLPNVWTATNDAWEFVPNGTGPVAQAPAPIAVDWYDINNVLIASNVDSLVVCPTQATTYYARWYRCGLLSASDTLNIQKNVQMNFVISNIVDANCFGEANGSFSVNMIGGQAPYSLTLNGNAIASGPQGNLTSNTYTVVATDANNCTETTTVFINQPSQLMLGILSQTDVLCKYQNTGTVHLTASGSVPPYVYYHNSSPSQVSPNFDSMRAGNFTFSVEDSHGCITSLPVTVNEPAELLNVTQVTHEATCLVKNDGMVESLPTGGIPPYQYEWNTSPMQTTQNATNLKTGVYHVLVTDANNCITATQIQVEQQLCCELFMPDAFTPNGDSRNDKFKIIERGGGVILGEFRIYNRWGQEIFSTRDITQGWNGEYKGVLQSNDTYHYIIQYQCNDKGAISQKIGKGDFLLLR